MSESATIEHKLPPTERIAVKAKEADAPRLAGPGGIVAWVVNYER